MSTFAAVMTGQGTGAISTIQVFGNSAEIVIKKIFKPAGSRPAVLKSGTICIGTIIDGSQTIDQVAIGCETAGNYAINCHGNPLIVEMIMRLLQRHGAKLLTATELLTKILMAEKPATTIEMEAKLAQTEAETLKGTKIIANQIDAGLSKTASEWLRNMNAISLDEIRSHAQHIIDTSQTAKLLIYGCTIVIAGPPNTGKSTLLNYLAGKPKAIVTDIEGTTRDWVSARCQIGLLLAEVIDTAGLDERLAVIPKNIIEKQAQEKSLQMLRAADLVLLVLDNSQTIDQFDARLLEKITGKKILTVLNKSDLPAGLDTKKLPQVLAEKIQISAKFGTGVENLLGKIQQVCGVKGFDLKSTVCFTRRQENLIKQLSNAKSKDEAVSYITELLKGRLSV